MKRRITFTTQYYFPGRVVWGVVGACSALSFFAAHFYGFSVCTLLIGMVAFTTHYGVAIDCQEKTYCEYVWILGFRRGERIPFDRIQYLFIKDFRVSETFNSRVNSAMIVRDEFRGYVKFSEESKVHILTDDDYTQLTRRLKGLAKEFGVGLVDYTFGNRIELI